MGVRVEPLWLFNLSVYIMKCYRVHEFGGVFNFTVLPSCHERMFYQLAYCSMYNLICMKLVAYR